MPTDSVTRSFGVDGNNSNLVSKEPHWIKPKLWVLYAMLAMTSWGLCNFGFGIIAEFGQPGANRSAAFVCWVNSGVIGIVALLFRRSFVKSFRQNKGEVCWCFFGGALACSATLAISLGMAACPQCKGAIVAVKPTQCFIVSLLSFVFYSESITLMEGVGMFGAFVGLAMMVFADTGENALVGLSLGFVCAQCFGIANFVLKHVTTHSTNLLSPAEATNFMNLSIGFFGVIALVTMFAGGPGLQGLRDEQSWLLFVACAISFAGVLGAVSLGAAFQHGGPGGVVVTIANAQAVVVLVLDIIFFTPHLDPMVLSGMAVVTLSVGLLAVVSPPRVDKRVKTIDQEQHLRPS